MKFKSRRANLHRKVAIGITTTFAIGFTYLLYKSLEWYQNLYQTPMIWGLMIIAPLLCVYVYYRLHRKYIRRAKIYKTPFPGNWRKVLEQYVSFYKVLTPKSKERFEKGVQVFLSERKIQGVHTRVDDLTRVLVAAAAVIPSFGYVDWEYDQLGTIFILPNSFDQDFNFGKNARGYIAGMVTNENMLNAMILSQKDVIESFEHSLNGRNVPVHEFTHLIDKGDGAIDGDLSLYWNKKQSFEWRSLMYHEMTRIWKGETFIDPYATTNPAEFLAVMSEYFFELPELLYHEHPEVYHLLKQGYRLDTRTLMLEAPQSTFYHNLKHRIALEKEEKARLEAERMAEIQRQKELDFLLAQELEEQQKMAILFQQMLDNEKTENNNHILKQNNDAQSIKSENEKIKHQSSIPSAAPEPENSSPNKIESLPLHTSSMQNTNIVPDAAPVKIKYTLA